MLLLIIRCVTVASLHCWQHDVLMTPLVLCYLTLAAHICLLLQAEQKMLAAGYNKEYLPIEGLDAFRSATVQLLLGQDHPALKEGRVAVLQVSSYISVTTDLWGTRGAPVGHPWGREGGKGKGAMHRHPCNVTMIILTQDW
jgi:hypothetical protein